MTRHPSWAVVERFKAAIKTAGWSGYSPMSGDAPMDLLAKIATLNPVKAAALVLRALESQNFSDCYGAMGVWDVVMSSGITSYVQAFSQLKDDVKRVAGDDLPLDENEWHEIPAVQKFLASYQDGRPTGKLRVQFAPEIKGAWYLASCSADATGDVEVHAVMVNQYTKERKSLTETFGAPDDVSAESVEVERYAAKGEHQQSALLKITDENGDEWDRQIEFDSVTGELNEDESADSEWEKLDSSW